MNRNLSARQQAILHCVKVYRRDHDFCPSFRQIQEYCGISSTSVVAYNLTQLERKGYITRDRAVQGIQLTGRRRYVSVPVLGTLVASTPIMFDRDPPWYAG